MTCIVAWIDKEKGIIMAGDKECTLSDGEHVLIENSKIFYKGKKNQFLIGITGKIRKLNVLRYSWEPPEKGEKETEEHYIYISVVNSIIDCFKGIEYPQSAILLAYNNKIYGIYSDYGVVEFKGRVASVGVASKEVRGILNIILGYEKNTKKILDKTYEIINSILKGVSKDYNYLILKRQKKWLKSFPAH